MMRITIIKSFCLCICLLILGFISYHAIANDSPGAAAFNDRAFVQIPIQHEGRIKPLGGFAKTILKQIHGHDRFNSLSASHLLAELLFNPARAIEKPLISVRNEHLLTKFELDQERTYFSLQELSAGLSQTSSDLLPLMEKEQDDLSIDEKDLLALHESSVSLMKLLRSLSMVLPLDVSLPSQYQTQGINPTYLDLLPIKLALKSELKQLIAKKGDNPENYTEDEQKLALLIYQLDQISQAGTLGQIFQIIPPTQAEEPWNNPWQIATGSLNDKHKTLLNLWADMAFAYCSNDALGFEVSSRAALSYSLELSDQSISRTRLQTELIYQTIKPYRAVMALYVVAFLFGIWALRKSDCFVLKHATSLAFVGAIAAHGMAILARMYILERPPVGTLYESVLFVSWITALLAFLIATIQKKPLLSVMGSLAAIGLLGMAPITAPNADSLEVLVAVLNTNFWLATHVTIITAGYGACVLCAFLSHGYLIARLCDIRGGLLIFLQANVYKLSLFALLLTTIGTILGGIWADQSWGRFWGWDPKENGALLIVLWLIWIQHGRLSGHIRPLPFHAAIAYLNVIVAIAWFGVNLLGVGLHSYGFTSGLASGLAIFVATQTALIAGLWIAIRWKEKSPP